ncbi:MAG: hypothetical protein AB1757_27055 [Acidobacteriota bacterium]
MLAVALLTAALALMLLIFSAIKSARPAQSLTPRDYSLMVPVQIICGDCAGEADTPRRTCLNAEGRCANCNGNSYVLASELAQRAARARQLRQRRSNDRGFIPYVVSAPAMLRKTG